MSVAAIYLRHPSLDCEDVEELLAVFLEDDRAYATVNRTYGTVVVHRGAPEHVEEVRTFVGKLSPWALMAYRDAKEVWKFGALHDSEMERVREWFVKNLDSDVLPMLEAGAKVTEVSDTAMRCAGIVPDYPGY